MSDECSIADCWKRLTETVPANRPEGFISLQDVKLRPARDDSLDGLIRRAESCDRVTGYPATHGDLLSALRELRVRRAAEKSALSHDAHKTNAEILACAICNPPMEISDAIECLKLALPFLRAHAHVCEVCEGGGEILRADDSCETCQACKPIWDLIARIQPPRPQPTSIPIAQSPIDDDDLPF
jgi:hypothetical protein